MLVQAGAAVTATALAAAATWLAQQRQPQPQPAGLEGTPVSALWRSLIAAAGSVDVTDSTGRTALHIAAETMPAAVEVLLSAGASMSSTCGSFGDTVLHAAAIRSCWVLQEERELVRSVLQRLAAAAAAAGCLNAFNAHGETPLALLICDDTRANRGLSCLERVRVLLAAGADPNATGPDTDTPLVRAVRECDENPCGIEVVSAVLSASADPYLAPEHDLPSTAIGIAVWKGQIDVVRLLLQAGACPSTEQVADVQEEVCYLQTNGLEPGPPQPGGSEAGLQILQVLLAADPPNHPQPTPSQVTAALKTCLWQEGGYATAAQLLLHLQRADGSAVDAMRGVEVEVSDPPALRLALLQGWAAAVATVDAERAALVTSQVEASAVMLGFREPLLGVALVSKS